MRSNHWMAVLALSSVSWVVKVLLARATRVVSGLSPFNVVRISAPSTLEIKCRWISGWANSWRAFTASFGPRSDPPIPILTTSVIALPVLPSHWPLRILSLASFTACNCCLTRAMRWLSSSELASSGSARRAAWRTARFSVVLIISPANMAVRWLCSGDCSAKFSSCCQISSLTRFLE